MFDKEIFGERSKDTSWKITITNEKTGKVEIEHGNVGGGLFVVNRYDDASHPIGTDQACFGEGTLIAVCAVKTPVLMREMIKKIGLEERVHKLVKLMGMDTSIIPRD